MLLSVISDDDDGDALICATFPIKTNTEGLMEARVLLWAELHPVTPPLVLEETGKCRCCADSSVLHCRVSSQL